jgi:signal transduction histidine kinase
MPGIGTMSPESEGVRLRRLLDIGRTLTTELDQRAVLDRVLETAREITGARYAAVGILNEQRTELAQFLTSGVDEATHRAIGDLPHGRGVLGALIDKPQPLRLADVGAHPTSYGFPAGHPVMRGFLGVPVVIRGHVWGNLYLTEKDEGEFTEADEEAAVILAQWASIAIENARLYETSERRRQESEKTARGLQATRDIAVAIGGEIALEHVLELIAKRGRALVHARSLVIMLRDGEELVVQTSAGHAREMRGVRLPISGSTSGEVLERRRAERITDVGARLRTAPSEFGVADPQTALLVPMLHRGDAVGILAAFDRGEHGELFSEDDEHTLRTFASSAATAVALAQSVAADRLRSSLASAEGERRRWARELHDETLQGLAGLRVLLSSALRRADPDQHEQTMHIAIEHIEREIENLRTIITELRPAALDELGLKVAIEALLDRHREQSGLQIAGELTLPDPAKGAPRLDRDLESAVYRLVQEALTNVTKHAEASTVRVAVGESDGELQVEVQDDGKGFDPDTASQGFGLHGMRERVSLAGGTLTVSPSARGTLIRACLPAAASQGEPVQAQQAAG